MAKTIFPKVLANDNSNEEEIQLIY